ncbi:hypothetical protein MKP08_06810 [Erythrobacter sp. LQ02-29]|uniref:hypothetical protein n=1 Tax=unclassified Erythrobacter TaxID=2633097 RepID=UPI001BFCD088|nr:MULTISPECIES: hypothetical protein [unclassified Erythrobacter]MCP9222453.1 hypothetical protein [Erythrobacter sp. LQ02-29]QWC56256.1 hypothetical protein F7D01_03375 [Erythrobacter sp. 3-20A1M]
MADETRIANRYWLLQLVRLICVVAAVYGAAITAHAVEGDATLGGVLFIAGTVGFFFGPLLLARHWRGSDR